MGLVQCQPQREFAQDQCFLSRLSEKKGKKNFNYNVLVLFLNFTSLFSILLYYFLPRSLERHHPHPSPPSPPTSHLQVPPKIEKKDRPSGLLFACVQEPDVIGNGVKECIQKAGSKRHGPMSDLSAAPLKC